MVMHVTIYFYLIHRYIMDLCDCSYMLNAIIMLSLIFLFTFFAWKSTYVPIKVCINLNI